MSEVKFSCQDALPLLKKGNAKHVELIKNEGKRITFPVGYKDNDPDDGQAPYAAILSCADSRVIPESIFTATEGELFVVRVAGNTANTSSIASLEYAVKYLDVRVIVVLGHEKCGAVEAAIMQARDRINFEPNLNSLLAHINPAINNPTENELRPAVVRNAENSAKELLSQSEILKDFYNNRGLNIFHGYYQMYGEDAGKVHGIDNWTCSTRREPEA